jgi:hypothetical protein
LGQLPIRGTIQPNHHDRSNHPLDPENAPSIVIPLAIFIAVLTACGVIAMVLMLLTSLISLS